MIAAGCLVQWYEIEMYREYIDSLVSAIGSDKDKVLIDLCLVTNQDLEKIHKHSLEDIESSFISTCLLLKEEGFKVNFETIDSLYSIADYRRDFNERYRDEVEILFWGESDMLVPSQAIQTILSLHNAVKDQTPKWLGFFATCKMWDDSWKILEHPKLTDLPRDPYAWYGTRSYMPYDKMEEINKDSKSPEIIISPEYKFNGCGLFFSSEIVKAGANIPESVFFTHEDTGFMNLIKLKFGNSTIPYYIVKNILLVHNREHPKKRMYVQRETGIDINEKRKSNEWYKVASRLSEHNAYTFNTLQKQYNWNDVWEAL
jgi:hypothetical protein